MKKKRKVVFILIDGVGDVSYSRKDFKTPLQIAETPNLDYIAENGLTGLLYPYEPGKSCGSDTAHLSLFSYNPEKNYCGRGSFECMGTGIAMDVGDLGFKCNFSTINDETGVVLKRRCSRIFEEEGRILCEYLDKKTIPGFPDYEMKIKYSTEHRCGVRIRGPNLSNKITGTDPLRDNLELLECKTILKEGEEGYENSLVTSEVVKSASSEIRRLLKLHKINIERRMKGKSEANLVLFRGAGTKLEVQSFKEKHGMNGFMIAPNCMIAGFGLSIGLKLVKVEGATGDVHSDYDAKGRVFFDVICNEDEKYDFGFLHVKGTDDASHDGELEMKVKLIQDVDKMVGDLTTRLKGRKEEFVIVVTGDHSTPCSLKDHCYEPLPFAISAINFEGVKDKVKMFNEIDCSKGYLGSFSGMNLFDTIKKFTKL